MAAIVDDVQPKKEESTSVENTAMTEARARGTIAIGIAKLQPSVKLLIEYAKLWSYYTLIPFKVAQLTLDVLVLSLEITKLCLITAKANTNLFVQFFQQLLTMTSPEFSQQLIQQFATILQTLVETFLRTLQIIVQEFTGGLTKAFPSPPFGKFPGFSAPAPSTKDGMAIPTIEDIAPPVTFNGLFPEKSSPEKTTPI